MKTRFKNKTMQSMYELGLKATYPLPNVAAFADLIGGSGKAAWTNGYLGNKCRYLRTSTHYALYAAGRQVAKIAKKNS